MKGDFLPQINSSIFDSKMFVPPKQIDKVKCDRHPVLDRTPDDDDTC
jgi:hypothetical protein